MDLYLKKVWVFSYHVCDEENFNKLSQENNRINVVILNISTHASSRVLRVSAIGNHIHANTEHSCTIASIICIYTTVLQTEN